jgi:hypothetical protein
MDAGFHSICPDIVVKDGALTNAMNKYIKRFDQKIKLANVDHNVDQNKKIKP